MDQILQLLDRGTWKHTWHLPKIGNSQSIDWHHSLTIRKIEEELREARKEAEWLLKVANDAEAELTEIKKSDSTIYVWRFHEAPEQYRQLSGFGGDEDWIVLVPPTAEMPDWVWHVGISETEEHITEQGWHVYIGAHA